MRNWKTVSAVVFIICLGYHLSTAQEFPKREFRGVWVTTAFNLDWPSEPGLNEQEQKDEFEHLLDQFEAHNLNAVIVQVRAAADAFYESDSEPWSYWLTGKQGKAPSYDPMAFMIEACHARNMEFHAWFNLFRAVSHTKFFDPSKNHVTKKHKDWCYEMTPSLYFDPGIPEVRNYLNGVVMEVVRKYDIDGVHLDDYFYHQESRDKKIKDHSTFKKYGNGFSNISDWRRDNVNQVIHALNDSIKSVKRHVKFGISPAPVWRHKYIDARGSNSDRALTSYDDLYADSRTWIENHWVDYIMPQLYWSYQHKGVGFETMRSWWNNNTYNRHLYIGLALYKVGNDPDKSWTQTNELTSQLVATRTTNNIQGISFFKASSFGVNNVHIEDTLKTIYLQRPALLPTMPWLDSIPPRAPFNLTFSTSDDITKITWETPKQAIDGDFPKHYVIYRFDEEQNIEISDAKNIIGISGSNEFIDQTLEKGKSYMYLITSLDKLSNESRSFIGAWHQHPK